MLTPLAAEMASPSALRVAELAPVASAEKGTWSVKSHRQILSSAPPKCSAVRKKPKCRPLVPHHPQPMRAAAKRVLPEVLEVDVHVLPKFMIWEQRSRHDYSKGCSHHLQCQQMLGMFARGVDIIESQDWGPLGGYTREYGGTSPTSLSWLYSPGVSARQSWRSPMPGHTGPPLTAD